MRTPMSSKELDRLLAKSEKLIEEDRLEEALLVAREIRAMDPKAPEFFCLEGGILGELGRIEEAIPLFEAALAQDKNHPEALGALAELLIYGMGDDAESVEKGLALCRRGIRVAKSSGDLDLLAELYLLQGIGLSTLGAFRDALESFEAASTQLAQDPELLQERGIALFHLWRFSEARKVFETLIAMEPEAAWGHHYLGLLAERRGALDEAEASFRRARELSPDEIPQPVRMAPDEFDAVVEDAIAQLPEKVRKYLGNVAIAVEDIPRESEFQNDETVTPTVLGVFQGSPLGEKSTFDPWSHFPNSILLFQKNLERSVSSREELIDEIGVTLLHEVGHFLGFDEDDLRERDLD